MKNWIVAILLTVGISGQAIAAHPQCGETQLADIMADMKKAMKAYKGGLKANDTDAMAKAAQQLKDLIAKSDGLIPLQISDNAELDKAQQQDYKMYQKGMKMLAGAIEKLAAANGQAERKEILGKIGKLSKKGHKSFKMDCDD